MKSYETIPPLPPFPTALRSCINVAPAARPRTSTGHLVGLPRSPSVWPQTPRPWNEDVDGIIVNDMYIYIVNLYIVNCGELW